MRKQTVVVIMAAAVVALSGGCVERQLTIKTTPPAGLVTLNDEQIGVAPVTVNFNWYGDYAVRIEKQGYQTLKTHRKLKGPWYDYFPFDLFAQIFYPGRISDSYEWTFELEKKKQPTTGELIKSAHKLKEQLK